MRPVTLKRAIPSAARNRALLVGALLLVGPMAHAQVTTGIPPFGSFGGGPDVINLANLNVHLGVPAVQRSGRGESFSYAINYDSSVWYPAYLGGTPPYAWRPASNSWGWSGFAGGFAGYITYYQTNQNCMVNGQLQPITIYNSWTYYDQAGTSHYFSGAVSPPTLCPNPPPTSATWVATDGSGYSMSADATNTPPTATVAARSGIIFKAPVQTFTPAGTIQDTNGNQMSTTDGTTFYDTLSSTTPVLTITGSAPNPSYYKYYDSTGTQQSVTVAYMSYNLKTNFGCSNVAEDSQNGVYLVSTVTYPDQSYYQFTYEPTPNYPGYYTGRIASVRLPAGGTISYTYTGSNNGINCADGSAAGLERFTPDTGSNYWQYSHTESGSAWTTTVTDPQSNATTYNFQTIYETERQLPGGVETVYTCYGTSGNAAPGFPCNDASVSLPVTQRVVTTSIGGLEAQTIANFDWNSSTHTSVGVATEVDEYGFGSGAVGPLLRKTVTQYATLGNNILDHPSTVTVYDGGGTLLAQTTYSYDQGSLTGTSSPQHVSVSGSRGNLTGTSTTAQNVTGSITRSWTYYDTGNVKVATDPRQNPTTYGYSGSSCGNSFPTSISMPLSLSTSATWNCYAATVATSSDPNGQTTSFTYDLMNRLTQTTYPSGGGTASTTYTSPTQIDQYRAVTSSSTLHTQTLFDGLGRTVHQYLASDPLGTDAVDTTYDSLGRISTVYNPYRTTSDPSYGFTTYGYDVVSRVTRVTNPDTTYSQVGYGSGTQTCSPSTYGYGYPVLSTDESLNQRRSFADALGRTIEVDEPDPNNGNTLTLKTCYSYDALGDLTSVSQGAQTRTFTYDGLGRLLTAATPEASVSGTQCTTWFVYDANGNVASKTAPKPNQTVCPASSSDTTDGVITNYVYDALNRLTSKTYSDNWTPAASFFYDETSAAGISIYTTKGRMSHWTATANGSTLSMGIYSYYATGLPQDYWQCTGPDCGSPPAAYYNYDLAGDLTGVYPPSMPFQLGLAYDSAQRLTSVTQNTSSWIDTTRPATLANFPAYTPFGAVDTLTDGCVGTGCSTPYQEKYGYNNRLQPVLVQVGTTASPNYVSCDAYYYYSGFSPPPAGSCPATAPTSGTGNNGKPMGWSHWDLGGGGSGVNNTTNYAYDSLNRLTQATMASHYTQNYNHDRYGNMVCSGNYCNITVAFDSATNHITTTGFTYDAAGNLTKDGTGLGTHTFQWDAEGRMVSVDGVAGQACQSSWTDCFTYNALGQRVQKHVGSPASDTYYYYDVFGNLAMTKGASQVKEYLFPGNFGKYYWTGSVWETDYTHKNTLGSTQVVTRADGSCAQAENLYPFGGKRWRGCGGTQDVRFAGMQERDLETETWQDTLDPTPNRTYTSGLGRWFSPDPVGGDVSNPQSLNRYAYALNNPTTLTDPSGLGPNPPPQGEIYADFLRVCSSNPDCAEWYATSGPWPQGVAPPGFNLGPWGFFDTDPNDIQCAYVDNSDASCAAPPGLFPNGQPIRSSGLSVGFWGGGSSGPLSGDYGANLPPLGPRGPGIPCDFGPCGGGPRAPSGNGFAEVAVLPAVAEGLGEIVCPWCAIGLVVAPLAAQAIVGGYQIYLNHKADIRQVRDAARLVSREPGCRSPDPEDFNTVHEVIKDQKGPDGKVSWNALLEAWREVLCK